MKVSSPPACDVACPGEEGHLRVTSWQWAEPMGHRAGRHQGACGLTLTAKAGRGLGGRCELEGGAHKGEGHLSLCKAQLEPGH